MFAARQRPLLVLEDRLLAMRLSLNTPVLATAELPSGPARAAIFAYAEGNARRFGVAVRALRGGNAVVYELQAEAPADADGFSVALDATLSFGESMGFLFDDEMIVDRRPDTLTRALHRLRELISPGQMETLDDDAVPEIGSPDDLAEILLEDELDFVSEPATPGLDDFAPPPARVAVAPAPAPVPAPAPTPAPVAVVAPAFAPGVALSKFRSPPPPVQRPVAGAVAAAPAPEAPASPGTSRGPATLGRVRPVRVRVDGEGGPRTDPLLRLLADF